MAFFTTKNVENASGTVDPFRFRCVEQNRLEPFSWAWETRRAGGIASGCRCRSALRPPWRRAIRLRWRRQMLLFRGAMRYLFIILVAASTRVRGALRHRALLKRGGGTLRPLCFAVLGVLLASVVDASTAAASCGDWLAHSSPAHSREPAADSSASRPSEAGDLALHPESRSADAPPGRRTPCAVTWCRQLPPAPAAPPSRARGASEEKSADWQVIFAALRLFELPRITRHPDGEPFPGFPPRIDRPPQLPGRCT